MKHTCSRCTRSFIRKRYLTRHSNDQQVMCRIPTHYCKSCDKGFSSVQSLCNHKRRCRTERHTTVCTSMDDIRDNDTVSALHMLNEYINKPSNDYTSINVIPYMTPSQCNITADTPAKRSDEVEIASPSQKKLDHHQRNVSYSLPVGVVSYPDNKLVHHVEVATNTGDEESEENDGEGDDNDDDEEIQQHMQRLQVLSKLMLSGYVKLKPAISDTINTLKRLDVLTEEQYQSLTLSVCSYL